MIQKSALKAKFMLLGVAVMRMAATESSNASVKGVLRKKLDELNEVSEE